MAFIVSAMKNELNLNNMANLNNCVTVFKNKGYGDRRFYVGYNNQSVDTTNWSLGDLYNFLQNKFKSVPTEQWNEFVELIDSYQ